MDVALAPEDETRDSVSRMSALDLYEDLLIDEDKDDENRVFTMQEILEEKTLLEAQNACLLNQISEMKLQMSEMSEENSRLHQHFDSLLATARVELDRKNDLLNHYQTKCSCGSVSFPVNAGGKENSARKVERIPSKPKQKKKCLADLFKGRRISEDELQRPSKTLLPEAPKKTVTDAKKSKKSTSLIVQPRKTGTKSDSGKQPAKSNEFKESSPRRNAREKDADKRPSSKVVKANRDSKHVKNTDKLPTERSDPPSPVHDLAFSQYKVLDEVSADSLEKGTDSEIGVSVTRNTPVMSTPAGSSPVKRKAKRKSNEPRRIRRSPHVNLPQGPHRPLSQSPIARQIAVTSTTGVSGRPPKRVNGSVNIEKDSNSQPPLKKTRKSDALRAARGQQFSPTSTFRVLNANDSGSEQFLLTKSRDLSTPPAEPVRERSPLSRCSENSDKVSGKLTQPGNGSKIKDNSNAESVSETVVSCPNTECLEVDQSSTNRESRCVENDGRRSVQVNEDGDCVRQDLDAAALSKGKRLDIALSKRRDKPSLSGSSSELLNRAGSLASNRDELDQGCPPDTDQTVKSPLDLSKGSLKRAFKAKKSERVRFSARQVPVGFQPKVRLIDIRTRTPVKEDVGSAAPTGDESRAGKRKLFTRPSHVSPKRMKACDDASFCGKGKTSEVTSMPQEAVDDDVLVSDLQLSCDSENMYSSPDDDSASVFSVSAGTLVENHCQPVQAQSDVLEDISCTATPSEPITTPSKDTATLSKHTGTRSKHTTTPPEPTTNTLLPLEPTATPSQPTSTPSKRVTTPSKLTTISSELTSTPSKLANTPAKPTTIPPNHSTHSKRTTIISEHAITPSKHTATPPKHIITPSNHSTPSIRTTTVSERTNTPPSRRTTTISEHTITPSSKRTITPMKFQRRAANVTQSHNGDESPAAEKITPSKNPVRSPGTLRLSAWLASARSGNGDSATECAGGNHSESCDYENSGRISSDDVPHKVDIVGNDQLAAKPGHSRNAALRWLVRLGLEELEGERRGFFHSQRKMWLTSLEKCQQRRKENAKWSS